MSTVSTACPVCLQHIDGIAEHACPIQPVEMADSLIDTLIDRRYRVIKRLGEGGMGIVYKVEHIYLNKWFTLKVMRPTQDEVDRRRFEQEARLASSIRHPNVVEISDFGALPTGQPYFVMEFLRGHSLGDAILEDQLDSLLTCLIAVQIASGLQAVHKQNVVHRDLKPDNIFLVDPDDQAAEAASSGPSGGSAADEVTFVKIMDFGIAKSQDNKLTGRGMTVGTPEYMSPEQATNDRVDNRTDQYSMGCIVYEMLTGFLPFEGQSAFEVMNKHLTELPMPPRQRRPDRAAEIPEGLEQIVLRMLAKDRNTRYANMRLVEQALREQAALVQRQRLLNQRPSISPSHPREPTSPPDRHFPSPIRTLAIRSHPRDPTPPPDRQLPGPDLPTVALPLNEQQTMASSCTDLPIGAVSSTAIAGSMSSSPEGPNPESASGPIIVYDKAHAPRVSQLINALQAAPSSMVDQPADSSLANSFAILPAVPAEPLRIGRFEIRREIASGGMATVYEGLDASIGLRVAVKMMRLECCQNQELVGRFLREGLAANMVQDEGLVGVLESGRLPNGRPYLVMEYVDGETLRQRLGPHKSGLPLAQVIRWGQTLAASMSRAHARSLIHRDLKPSNIMIVPDRTRPEGERTKILDFGIAKVLSSASSDDTRAGLVLGTPSYMAPEQCRGEAINDRADVYALGVILYEMGTGTSPFAGDEILQVMLKHQSYRPPQLGQVRREIPTRLAALVERMLEKQPSERPTMAQCSRELDAIALARVERSSQSPLHPGNEGRTPRRIAKTLAAVARLTLSSVGSPEAPWEALYCSLPLSMRGSAEAAARFLDGAFKTCEHVCKDVVRLIEPRKLEGGVYEFFAVFLHSSDTEAVSPVLATSTFVDQTHYMAQYLQRLEAPTVKVVLVFTEFLELGRGVREKILEYRQQFNALVLPLYLGEVRRTRPENAGDLLIERVKDLHGAPNPFETEGPLTDPMRFFGMRTLLNHLIFALCGGAKSEAVALCGLPGSGKSTLLNMLEYYLPSTRFVRVSVGFPRGSQVCSSLSVRLTEELGSIIAEEFDDKNAPASDRAKSLLQALTKRDGRTILVLEDADALLAAGQSIEESDGTLALLERMAALARSGSLGLVVTGIHLSWLKHGQIAARPNPLMCRIRWLRMPGLDFPTCAKLLGDLGLQANLSFESVAVRTLYGYSGGNITLALRLASTIVTQHHERTDNHLLSRISVGRRSVEEAASIMITRYGTFADYLLPCLSLAQHTALCAVVFEGPRRARIMALVRQQLDATTNMGRLMDGLQQIGLITERLGRMKVSLPLLDSWMRTHLDAPPLLNPDRLRSATLYVALMLAGATLSMLLYTYAWLHIGHPVGRLLLGISGLVMLGLAIGKYLSGHSILRSKAADNSRRTAADRSMRGATSRKAGPLRIFCSYSHEDQSFAHDLEKHISILRREGIAEYWQYQLIPSGEDWRSEIERRLDEADIILLLVSASFINSDFCYEEELRRARQRHQEGNAKIIPIIVRAVEWKETWIGTLQACPQEGRPISQCTDADAAWTAIIRAIRRIAAESLVAASLSSTEGVSGGPGHQ